MKIATRYILREHLGPLIFAFSALTSLLLLNFVAKRFGDLVGKGLPWSVIAEFLLLSVPFTLAMTLPMAVLVSTLHAFSRLAAENELTAFKANGVSMQRLMRPVILASIVLTLFMVWFNDQVLPRANHRLATLQSDIARVKPTLALSEQVINEVVPRQLFLRAGRIAAGTNRMRDVTIYDLGDPARRRTIVADSGLLAFSSTGEDLLLTLFDGSMTEVGTQEPARLQRNFFREDVIRVRGIAVRLERNEDRAAFKSDRELTVCELEQRVRQAAAQRNAAWLRLLTVEKEGARSPLPPPIPGGVGGAYCAALRELQRHLSPPEAIAATLQPAARPGAKPRPPKPASASMPSRAPAGAPSGAAELAVKSAADAAAETAAELMEEQAVPAAAVPDDTESSVLIDGMRLELEIAEHAIDQFRVEIEKKFAIAVACIVFVLLGAPIALRFPRGGVGLTIGVSLGVFGIYYIGLLGGEALADRALVGPVVAMWGTNLLLGLVGLVLTARLGNEGSTSRGSETAEWWYRVRQRFRSRRAA